MQDTSEWRDLRTVKVGRITAVIQTTTTTTAASWPHFWSVCLMFRLYRIVNCLFHFNVYPNFQFFRSASDWRVNLHHQTQKELLRSRQLVLSRKWSSPQCREKNYFQWCDDRKENLVTSGPWCKYLKGVRVVLWRWTVGLFWPKIMIQDFGTSGTSESGTAFGEGALSQEIVRIWLAVWSLQNMLSWLCLNVAGDQTVAGSGQAAVNPPVWLLNSAAFAMEVHSQTGDRAINFCCSKTYPCVHITCLLEEASRKWL